MLDCIRCGGTHWRLNYLVSLRVLLAQVNTLDCADSFIKCINKHCESVNLSRGLDSRPYNSLVPQMDISTLTKCANGNSKQLNNWTIELNENARECSKWFALRVHQFWSLFNLFLVYNSKSDFNQWISPYGRCSNRDHVNNNKFKFWTLKFRMNDCQ